LAELVERTSKAYDQKCVVAFVERRADALRDQSFDIVVVIPDGFSENLTSLNEAARLVVSARLDSAKLSVAEAVVLSAIEELSSREASRRIQRLSELANLAVDPRVVTKPIEIVLEAHRGAGLSATREEGAMLYSARLLAFALFFAVTPTTAYVSDAFMGEKERRTIEALLATPAKLSHLLISKLVASSALGLVAGIADVVGLLVYFELLGRALGGLQLGLSAGLVGVHSVAMTLTVFATSAMLTPVVTRAGSVRAANAASGLVTGLAMVVFFVVLFADPSRLPISHRCALYLVPQTHGALAVLKFASGQAIDAILHLTLLVAVSIALYALAYKRLDPEKLVAPLPSR
ncbi:MAG: ABC transporter permease, partial [Fervidicoccaceae archaeon]